MAATSKSLVLARPNQSEIVILPEQELPHQLSSANVIDPKKNLSSPCLNEKKRRFLKRLTEKVSRRLSSSKVSRDSDTKINQQKTKLDEIASTKVDRNNKLMIAKQMCNRKKREEKKRVYQQAWDGAGGASKEGKSSISKIFYTSENQHNLAFNENTDYFYIMMQVIRNDKSLDSLIIPDIGTDDYDSYVEAGSPWPLTKDFHEWNKSLPWRADSKSTKHVLPQSKHSGYSSLKKGYQTLWNEVDKKITSL